MPVVAVKRGCGRRVAGEIHAEAEGSQLYENIIDPPARIAMDNDWTLTPTLVEDEGIWHVIDWVGMREYPNVADYIEEAKRFGVSRFLPTTLDFSKLTEDSRLILAHSRAWINDHTPYAAEEQLATALPCPKKVHRGSDAMCARFWWQDVDPIRQHEDIGAQRRFRRRMPSFEYEAETRPADVEPRHSLAVFLTLPIERLVVVRGGHEQALTAAGKSRLRLDAEDE